MCTTIKANNCCCSSLCQVIVLAKRVSPLCQSFCEENKGKSIWKIDTLLITKCRSLPSARNLDDHSGWFSLCFDVSQQHSSQFEEKVKARISPEIQFLVCNYFDCAQQAIILTTVYHEDRQSANSVSRLLTLAYNYNTRKVVVSGLGVSCCTSFGCFDMAAEAARQYNTEWRRTCLLLPVAAAAIVASHCNVMKLYPLVSLVIQGPEQSCCFESSSSSANWKSSDSIVAGGPEDLADWESSWYDLRPMIFEERITQCWRSKASKPP